ncbi:uncharacterized protein HD556DRAFT_1444348 [Suillus plorans]|uniref:Uncharacterized protein n=1 Tax=Suillus plorans TaxID=116603 RepID=A0A9P7AMX3_9AGAM|nr:uncharacterized protein HD556DRAFT_1444348 [Suillus plorans]KAG1792674.1 hypothetical protein HD556DRAFT_1444348 [Suillus plorans]
MSKAPILTTLCQELQENICDFLNLAELSVFASVSSLCYMGVEEYINGRKLVIFARFVSDTEHFITLLRRTDAVVSGSCALNIVQAKEGATEINDLDIYTTLQKFEDLELPSPPPGPYNTSGIAKLFRFQKGKQNVDIIVTNLASAVAPVFQFHSTIVMNFISADVIFCAYPAWTLDMLGLIHPRTYKQNGTNYATIQGLAKYMQRGFTLYSDIGELSPHDNRCVKTYYCPHVSRSTNDKGKLAWEFKRTERDTAKGKVRYTDTNAVIWCLGGDQCNNERITGAPSFVFAT